MSFLTKLALQRPTVTLLVILMVLVGGVVTYRSLQVELFPEIEFPLVTISTSYPSANPESVVRDVTEPIERAILGIDGVDSVQSTSSEGRSVVLANFEFGVDMAAAEQAINNNIASISFPRGVDAPSVARVNPDSFPVLQFSVIGDRNIPSIQGIVDSQILPAISGVDGIQSVEVVGGSEEQVFITVDADKLSEQGVSFVQVSRALSENNVQIPGGAISDDGRLLPVKISHTYGSLEDLRNLVVSAGGAGGPVLLSDVAEVRVAPAAAASVSRTNGMPSLGINVQKKPEANTVEVTSGVLENLDEIQGLPPDIRFVTLSNSGPAIQGQVDTLLREGLLGFLFAVTVVLAFLVSFRPGVLKGFSLALRPTIVIGLSIPLSILMGILLMGAAGMTLNLMSLGGLAIAVGRVVDDSIVVLENVYRHIQRGEDRWSASFAATKEVGAAITASTLTTIAVFAPLAFIQGLVGAFFLPFAVTVSFALVSSLLVALTAVPVLGALLLRPQDKLLRVADEEGPVEEETWMQRVYTPILVWALRHKLAIIIGAPLLAVASLSLLAFIPITLFPSGGPRVLTISLFMPPGTPIERSLQEVGRAEGLLEDLRDRGMVEIYQSTVGSQAIFGAGGGLGGAQGATVFVRLTDDAPDDLADTLRGDLDNMFAVPVSVDEVSTEGPPNSGLELTITGSDYGAISDVAQGLTSRIGTVDGVINVRSDVTQARPEVSVVVRPGEAARFGMTSADVASQVSQILNPQRVFQMDVNGATRDVILMVEPEDVGSLEKVRALRVSGADGTVLLDSVAHVGIAEGPVTISRTDGLRSATITGTITTENTQLVNREVQEEIEAVGVPPGVEVSTGGVFEQIAEGFQDVFIALAAGVLLIYLVMVASLGGLRNPFVIIMSLPLALVGALAALAITGRTLGLPAMMGILLLAGVVVTNAIVLIVFVEQLRQQGMGIYDALVQGGRVRLRPILMTALTTSFALLPLATLVSDEGGIIGAELATVVIGGLISSTVLTLIAIPVVYVIMHQTIPGLLSRMNPFPADRGHSQ